MDGEGIDLSATYRIEHRTPQGITTVRQVVEPNRLAINSMIYRVFQEVLAGLQARGETGVLVMIEEDTGRVVESVAIQPPTGAEG